MSDVSDEDYLVNGKKFAVIIVIDVSGSMSPYIDKLSDSFNKFIEESKDNKDVRDAMDIAVLTFETGVKDELDGFSDIKGVPTMHFSSGGSTNMADALKKANELARERMHTYKRMRIEAFKPWIILMSDGYPNNVEEVKRIGAEIKERERDQKVHAFALGMGEGYCRDVLLSITEKCIAIDDWNFSEFFSWLGKSVAMVSGSQPGMIGSLCDTGEEFQDMTGKFFGTL